MKKRLKSHSTWWPWLVFLVFQILLRTVYFHFSDPLSRLDQHIFWSGDSLEYQNIAINLLKTGEFKGFSYLYIFNEPMHTRVPLYPLFLAAHYFFTGINPLYPIITQNILMIISMGLIALLGYQMTHSYKTSLAAAFILSLEPTLFAMPMSLNTETLFLFLFSMHLLVAYLFYKKEQGSYLILSLLVLGLMSLTRPVAAYLVIPFLGVLLLLLVKYKLVKRHWKSLITGLTIYFCIIFPWILRNHNLFNTYQLSSQFGYNFTIYNVNSLEHYRTPVGQKYLSLYHQFIKEGHPYNPFQFSQYVLKDGLTTLTKKHLWTTYLLACLHNGLFHFWIDPPNRYFLLYLAEKSFAATPYMLDKHWKVYLYRSFFIYWQVYLVLFYPLSLLGMASYFKQSTALKSYLLYSLFLLLTTSQLLYLLMILD